MNMLSLNQWACAVIKMVLDWQQFNISIYSISNLKQFYYVYILLNFPTNYLFLNSKQDNQQFKQQYVMYKLQWTDWTEPDVNTSTVQQ